MVTVSEEVERLEVKEMLRTLEMRWFKRGEIPAVMNQWFKQACPGEVFGEAETRTDWYLQPIAPCNDLNIKFRQGRIEVKWREKQLTTVDLSSQGEGIMEQWVKWLCEAESLQDFYPQDSAWVAVEKARSQRQWELSSDAFCNVELTQLKVKDQNWWTFGLESTGDAKSLAKIAQAVSETCPEKFTEADAAAYPYWLTHNIR
ncbi:MAG: hypothetical protein RI580_15710 [Halothece sp. Uz-M2-17]|nr:hypothetical protein [Halothece sp. Uz-M2-17]